MPRLLCILLTLAGLSAGFGATGNQLNVVFILADDLGWADTTLYGHTKFYQTPNLERLAKRGMTFSRAYAASPLCSPTRSAILTGLSPARTGITTPNGHLPAVVLQATPGKSAPPNAKVIQPDPPTRLNPNYRTLAEALKEAGYATAHFGKWHLGPDPYSPLQQGFDVDLPHWPGPGPAGSFVAPWKFPKFAEKAPAEHIEDRMAREASAWMEQHKDAPFYLNYWMFSVHAPFDAKKALIEKHRGRMDPKDAQCSPTYAAMVESMDDAVGTLLDTLDRLKIADRTIIVFTSDNGGNMYSQVDGTVPTSNAPLRGGKATMFEGGTRVPCVIAWPGRTLAGSRSEAMIQSEDYYPTLLEGLGLKPAEGQRFDGVSVLPALTGEAVARDAVFQYFPHHPPVPDWLPPSVSVHRADWKLIRIFHGGENGAHRHLLFNLREDLSEKQDLAAQRPELVVELDALITRFLADTKAVVPIPNPAFDPAKYQPELEGKAGLKTKRGRAAAEPKPGNAKPAAGGWQISRDTKLERAGGVLKIQSTGKDPWIANRGLESGAKGPFTAKLRIASRTAGPGVFYYADGSGGAFNKTKSVDFALQHDGEARDYTVQLPAEQLSAIRLDPGNAPGEIIVHSIEVRDAAGTRVFPKP